MDLPRQRWIDCVMKDAKRVDDRITMGIATVDGKTWLKVVNLFVKKVQRIKKPFSSDYPTVYTYFIKKKKR